jgi:hypothetical protein
VSTHKYSTSDAKAQGNVWSLKLRRLDHWFPDRKYLPMVCATNCPLKHNERRVYSYLVFRLRQGQTATQHQIIRALTIGNHTASRIIEKLMALGMVAKEGHYFTALEPPDHEWFAWKRTGEVWFTRLATYREHRRQAGAPITEVANGVWSLMYSLSKADKLNDPPLLSCQTNTGIAKLLGCSVRQVRRAISWLKDQGLIQCCGGSQLMRPPSEQQLGWWHSRPERVAMPKESPKIIPVQIEGNNEVTRAINREIAKWMAVMTEAGYTPKQAVDYWKNDVIGSMGNNVEDILFILLLQGDLFGSLWREVESQHAKTGKSAINLALLRYQTPSVIGEAQREAAVA